MGENLNPLTGIIDQAMAIKQIFHNPKGDVGILSRPESTCDGDNTKEQGRQAEDIGFIL